jgi:hypothetical protein
MNHRSHTHALVAAALLNLLAGSAHAATLDVEVSLPTIASAAYHYPYLAAWIERADDQSAAGTLAVWYDQRLRDGLGKLFLHDLRSWWRKTGETTTLPSDGISGATRGPGTYALHFSDKQGTLAQLPAGKYLLAVEVVREQGGRSVLRAPFSWGGSNTAGRSSVSSNNSNAELSSIKASVIP